MNLKASVAPRPAFGHPLLAPLVSTHASATLVSPPCEGGVRGVVPAEPNTGLQKGFSPGLRRLVAPICGKSFAVSEACVVTPPFARGGNFSRHRGLCRHQCPAQRGKGVFLLSFLKRSLAIGIAPRLP